jgi:hypothetical protein
MNMLKEFLTDVYYGAMLLVVMLLVDLGIIDDMGDV